MPPCPATRSTARAGEWEAYTDNGREHTGLHVVEWAMRGEELGAGEILLTSVDREGTRRGFDVALTRAVAVLPEESGWNALARLYLAIAEIHG